MTDTGRNEATAEELGLAGEELRGADQLLAAGLPRIPVATPLR